MAPASRAAFGLACTIFLASGCGGEGRAKPAAAPRSVRLVAARKRELPRSVTVVGTLMAEERADLSFKVAGRLKSLHVDIGSRVGLGQVLAELEKPDYELRLARARGALTQARARLGLPGDGTSDTVVPETTAIVRQNKARMEQAAADLARNKSLLEQGLISKATFDVVDANFKVAESQFHDSLEEVNNRLGILAEKRSDVALAEQQLADTSLQAPFAGSVQERKAHAGEYLTAGLPVLSLVKLNPIRLRLDVPEREARTIRRGQTVMVRAEGSTGQSKGTVARVSPAIQEANRSLIVEAEIANPDGALKPGSFVKAEIDTGSGGAVLVVPSSAVVVFAGIEKVVFVREGKALEKQVVTGRRSGDLVEIVSGVEDGEKVVDRPGNLATGATVDVAAS